MKEIFVIGFPKSATTSIWSGLYRDPEISMLAGEPHPTLPVIENSLSELKGCYYIGFKSAVLIYLPENLEEVVNKFPDAYYIVSTRHPVSWLASFYDYRRKELESYVKTSEGWLSNVITVSNAMKTLNSTDFDSFAMSDKKFFDFDRSWGRFENYVNRFENMFVEKKNVLYMSQERIKSSPDLSVSNLYEFLGLDLTEDRKNNFIRMSNKGSKKAYTSMKDSTKFELEKYYSETIEFLNDRLLL